MKEIVVNQKIVQSLDLSPKEVKVFDALRKYSIARRVTWIAKSAGLPRTTVIYILRRFEKRNLVERRPFGKTFAWMYKKGLERMQFKSLGDE